MKMLAGTALCAAMMMSPALVVANDARTQALAAMEAGEAERAITILERALRTDRDNAELHYILGMAEMGALNSRGTLGQMRAAGRIRRAFERAVELDPAHLQARLMLMGFYAQAPGIAGGDKAKAREQMEAIARLDPVQGHRARATIHSMDNELPQAIAEITRAAALVKDNNELLYSIQGERGVLCQRVEDWSCAHEAFTAAVTAKEDFWMGWYQIGRTAVRSGERLEAGTAALERYLEHTPTGNQPSLAWAHTRLGEIYMKQERQSDALGQFQAALRLEPNHEVAKRLVAQTCTPAAGTTC